MTSRTIFILHPLSLSILFALACTPLKGDLGEYSASGATGAVSTGGGTTTTGEVLTGEATTTTGDELTGETAAGSTSTWLPPCLYDEPEVVVEVVVDAPTLIDPEAYPSEFDVRCTVLAAADGEIEMQCSDDLEGLHDVTLTVATPTPRTGLLGGETQVRLRYRSARAQEFGLDWRDHVAIHALDDDELLLFYGQGFDVFAAEFEAFWAPLSIQDGDLFQCPAWPDEALCGTEERSTVVFFDDHEGEDVFDGNTRTMEQSSLWLYVERAVQTVQTDFTNCADIIYGRESEVLVLKADL
ncbi:hypothetical protein [Nannocystis sp. SCPEA4]|uniref:hypothetical protein n=1 Tax=Nannocystis sp. SCPEA4 TaxID=2996787 RepID=UPI00226D9B37|nr:hypothetical protein [Nannocystis sp. SCPEA4]MCY1063044.1 hypothetical protein [Nannocystis sp. SCPEA4]